MAILHARDGDAAHTVRVLVLADLHARDGDAAHAVWVIVLADLHAGAGGGAANAVWVLVLALLRSIYLKEDGLVCSDLMVLVLDYDDYFIMGLLMFSCPSCSNG